MRLIEWLKSPFRASNKRGESLSAVEPASEPWRDIQRLEAEIQRQSSELKELKFRLRQHQEMVQALRARNQAGSAELARVRAQARETISRLQGQVAAASGPASVGTRRKVLPPRGILKLVAQA